MEASTEQQNSLENKYQIIKPGVNPNSLFSSFSQFKKLRATNVYEVHERPPYPIIIDNPSVSQVFKNLNKSDMLVALTFVGLGLGASVIASRRLTILDSKFYVTKYMMWWYSFFGMFFAMNGSFYRLTGFMDNGLRWKRKDGLPNKYDFTRDFERDTIFKYFRERVE